MVNKSIRKNNELIKKRRKKKRIKHFFIFIVFSISVAIVLCLKLPYFNISEVIVINNKIVNKEVILQNSEIKKGSNIFYLNTSNIITKIKKNPYIIDADITRNLPNQVIIKVDERDAHYYSSFNNVYYIMDNKGTILEKKNSLEGIKLIKLIGAEEKDCILGKNIFSKANRKMEAVARISTLKPKRNNIAIISTVDVSDIINIKVYFNNMCVKIGNDEDIENKINKGSNVIEENSLKDSKGYVDVSFKGNPVFFIEK